MNRGYYVCANGGAAGFAVVAPTAKEARKIVYARYPEDVEGIDLRCHWVRHAAVGDLPVGLIDDAREGLLRGFYGTLEEYPCDGCGKDTDVVSYQGRALCPSCILASRTNRRYTVQNKIIEMLKERPRTYSELPSSISTSMSLAHRIMVHSIKVAGAGSFRTVYYLEGDEARAVAVFVEVNTSELTQLNWGSYNAIDSGLSRDTAQAIREVMGGNNS